MPRTKEQYAIEVETVTRGTVYVEAPDEATALAMVEHATLSQALKNQVLHEAIKEKVSFTPLGAAKLICGVDYISDECKWDCPDCPCDQDNNS
jgi:hypothetical protein